ncbi:hypothetical protein FOG50_03926 [Hanseniaspora uvarum]|uniref:Uncharacterized protein n=1 Tax=Hanseniaspora uvarum TaxID=29833 RepID=A0A1E5RTM5_HANUV|nr:hypothetical protein FOG50_03926 [Hanseniaspora uvarum]OEJ90265.1 hypothetical protein AWRI3580_g1372 [Hanseniaspora uvarum]GMM41659.1 hypothetical protein DAHU10_025690 [Hanseniaspora uvarum]
MSSDNSKNSKTYSDDDVIQSIYSNKSNAYDLLNLVPNLLDRKAEQEYYNQLTEKNGLKVDNSKLSYYETIETLSNMGISQRVLFDKDQLSQLCKIKLGGGAIPLEQDNAFVSEYENIFLGKDLENQNIDDFKVGNSYHSLLGDDNIKMIPTQISSLIMKITNLNIEEVMLMSEKELLYWCDKTDNRMTKEQTKNLVNTFILYKKYITSFD